jgi:hypothetical protein
MSDNSLPETLNDNLAHQFAIAQYTAMRDEMMKRGEFRYQMTSLTLIVAGTFLTLGLQPSATANVLFVFPILGCFLASIWAHNVFVPRQIGTFIWKNIESRYKGVWWDTTIDKERFSMSWLSGILANSGIFLGTEIVCLVLGLLRATFILTELVLISLDCIAILITFFVLRSTTLKPKQGV